jgi:hypothetical protein
VSLGWEQCKRLSVALKIWLKPVSRCQKKATGNAPSVVSGTAVSTSGRTEWQADTSPLHREHKLTASRW